MESSNITQRTTRRNPVAADSDAKTSRTEQNTPTESTYRPPAKINTRAEKTKERRAQIEIREKAAKDSGNAEEILRAAVLKCLYEYVADKGSVATNTSLHFAQRVGLGVLAGAMGGVTLKYATRDDDGTALSPSNFAKPAVLGAITGGFTGFQSAVRSDGNLGIWTNGLEKGVQELDKRFGADPRHREIMGAAIMKYKYRQAGISENIFLDRNTIGKLADHRGKAGSPELKKLIDDIIGLSSLDLMIHANEAVFDDRVGSIQDRLENMKEQIAVSVDAGIPEGPTIDIYKALFDAVNKAKDVRLAPAPLDDVSSDED